jgi:hypothetical protein
MSESLVTVLSPPLATQMFAPSKTTPLGEGSYAESSEYGAVALFLLK